MLGRLTTVIILVTVACAAQKQPTPEQIQSSLLPDLRGDDPESLNPYGSLLDPRGPHMERPPVHPGARTPRGLISVEELDHKAPKLAKKWVDRGIRLAQGGDHHGAASDFEKAIGLDRSFAVAHRRLGVEYALLGRSIEAEAELRIAVRLQPHAVGPLFDLSILLYRKGDYPEAEREVKHVLDLSHTAAPAHLLLGLILVDQESRRSEAITELRFAAQTMPEAQKILDRVFKR